MSDKKEEKMNLFEKCIKTCRDDFKSYTIICREINKIDWLVESAYYYELDKHIENCYQKCSEKYSNNNFLGNLFSKK